MELSANPLKGAEIVVALVRVMRAQNDKVIQVVAD